MSVHSQSETPGALRQIITVNAHTLHADVSAAVGGQNSAPDPHDYFDVSLATCKALTASIYARQRGIGLETVVVEVERDASRERDGTYGLTVKLTFLGTLSDAEKQKLHDVLTRCPIHKLMTTTTVEVTQVMG